MSRVVHVAKLGKTFEFPDGTTDEQIDDAVNNEIVPKYGSEMTVTATPQQQEAAAFDQQAEGMATAWARQASEGVAVDRPKKIGQEGYAGAVLGSQPIQAVTATQDSVENYLRNWGGQVGKDLQGIRKTFTNAAGDDRTGLEKAMVIPKLMMTLAEPVASIPMTAVSVPWNAAEEALKPDLPGVSSGTRVAAAAASGLPWGLGAVPPPGMPEDYRPGYDEEKVAVAFSEALDKMGAPSEVKDYFAAGGANLLGQFPYFALPAAYKAAPGAMKAAIPEAGLRSERGFIDPLAPKKVAPIAPDLTKMTPDQQVAHLRDNISYEGPKDGMLRPGAWGTAFRDKFEGPNLPMGRIEKAIEQSAGIAHTGLTLDRALDLEKNLPGTALPTLYQFRDSIVKPVKGMIRDFDTYLELRSARSRLLDEQAQRDAHTKDLEQFEQQAGEVQMLYKEALDDAKVSVTKRDVRGAISTEIASRKAKAKEKRLTGALEQAEAKETAMLEDAQAKLDKAIYDQSAADKAVELEMKVATKSEKVEELRATVKEKAKAVETAKEFANQRLVYAKAKSAISAIKEAIAADRAAVKAEAAFEGGVERLSEADLSILSALDRAEAWLHEAVTGDKAAEGAAKAQAGAARQSARVSDRADALDFAKEERANKVEDASDALDNASKKNTYGQLRAVARAAKEVAKAKKELAAVRREKIGSQKVGDFSLENNGIQMTDDALAAWEKRVGGMKASVIKAHAEKMQRFNRLVREKLLDAGVISQEVMDKWDAKDFYAPFRYLDKMEAESAAGGRGDGKLTHAITGSSRKTLASGTLSPTMAYAEGIGRAIKIAAKNKLRVRMLELGRLDKTGDGWFREVKPGDTAKPGEVLVDVHEKGLLRRLAVPQEWADTIARGDAISGELLYRLAHESTSFWQAGVTVMNPGWAVVNQIYDPIRLALDSKYGLWTARPSDLATIWPVMARALDGSIRFTLMGEVTPTMGKALKRGGIGGSMWSATDPAAMRAKLGIENLSRKFIDAAKSPLQTLAAPARKLGQVSENFTKLVADQRGEMLEGKDSRNAGMSKEQVDAVIGDEVARFGGSPFFSRQTPATKSLSAALPMFGAAKEGIASTLGRFGGLDGKALQKQIIKQYAVAVVPMVAAVLYNRLTHKKEMRTLDDRDVAGGLPIFNGEYFTNPQTGEKIPEAYRIPVKDNIKFVYQLVDNTVRLSLERDKRSAERLLMSILNGIQPAQVGDSWNPIKMVTSVTGQSLPVARSVSLFQTGIDPYTGRDVTGGDAAGPSLKPFVSQELRRRTGGNKFIQAQAQKLGWNPAMVEAQLDIWLSSTWKKVLFPREDAPTDRSPLANTPLTDRFFRKPYGNISDTKRIVDAGMTKTADTAITKVYEASDTVAAMTKAQREGRDPVDEYHKQIEAKRTQLLSDAQAKIITPQEGVKAFQDYDEKVVDRYAAKVAGLSPDEARLFSVGKTYRAETLYKLAMFKSSDDQEKAKEYIIGLERKMASAYGAIGKKKSLLTTEYDAPKYMPDGSEANNLVEELAFYFSNGGSK